MCHDEWKRTELDFQYPQLCSLRADIERTLVPGAAHYPTQDAAAAKLCSKLKRTLDAFNVSKTSLEFRFLEEVFVYARENLALVHIYIKRPVVTKIMRDQRIPVIWFVANCGGILGLCMGFSIVTGKHILGLKKRNQSR